MNLVGGEHAERVTSLGGPVRRLYNRLRHLPSTGWPSNWDVTHAKAAALADIHSAHLCRMIIALGGVAILLLGLDKSATFDFEMSGTKIKTSSIGLAVVAIGCLLVAIQQASACYCWLGGWLLAWGWRSRDTRAGVVDLGGRGEQDCVLCPMCPACRLRRSLPPCRMRSWLRAACGGVPADQ